MEPILNIHPLARRREDQSDLRSLFLRNFLAQARVGVYDHEHGRGQQVRFDLEVSLRPSAELRDRLQDVLDYDCLRQGILDIVAAGHVNLLETLAERILAMCFGHPEVVAVQLRITKLQAHDDCEVGYEVRRRR
ncbi:MAG: dihydroneopterin aldolase [Betaproteobacteria bacterium]|jgi:dihydroneopterin aldolase|nr:dihydroneopterin aldolase [Rhodocyclaceae bacterium]MCA3136259.1 dihydroneopterin aldolase [Rhodocyclaceae bacterium]MCA3143875.1 dihydroneopterin aldolase [Rhodocyclaceae bacterium]MCA3146645.1 dihydroneopterin aldolase [Rhodocyclaceae bacterium]MCE2899212.1 dihydroneopterin aldolase [Betaproteobacteria bacterium]